MSHERNAQNQSSTNEINNGIEMADVIPEEAIYENDKLEIIHRLVSALALRLSGDTSETMLRDREEQPVDESFGMSEDETIVYSNQWPR